MPQNIYPFDAAGKNDSEFSFDPFTPLDQESFDFQSSKGSDMIQDEDLSAFTVEEIDDSDSATGEIFEPLREQNRENRAFVHEEDDENEIANNEQIEGLSTQTSNQLMMSRLAILRKTLTEVNEKISKALELIQDELSEGEGVSQKTQENFFDITGSIALSDPLVEQAPRIVLRPGDAGRDRVLEGVFDGENMVGSDGNQYAVPQNYASKSKLVEGDALKLTITDHGSFIYKQIGPVERTRLVGYLKRDEGTGWQCASKDSRRWRVLPASVTYFKGNSGDEVVLIVPRDYRSTWAAVENIIKLSS